MNDAEIKDYSKKLHNIVKDWKRSGSPRYFSNYAFNSAWFRIIKDELELDEEDAASIPKLSLHEIEGLLRNKNDEIQKNKNKVTLVALAIVAVILFSFVGASLIPESPPSPEQREQGLYEAWQAAKSNRDYWYGAAEKRYNKDGELNSAFKKYLEAERAADAAWQRYRDYSNSLEDNE